MKFRNLAILILTFCAFTGYAQSDSTKQDSSSINMPLISSGADLIQSDGQSQNISGLLQSSRDVYAGIAGFNFSAARFRLRGYSSENTNILIGGIPGSDPESGWTIWSYWGGLNDVTRYPESKMGIASSHSTFGGIGGYSSISLRASEKRKGHRASYAATNRSYTNRAMYSYNSGWKGDWAFSVSASTRWAKEGYVEGTSYSGGSYFAAVERRINENHTINLAGFGAPTVQGRRGIALQEALDLTGSNYYNPYWGYQTTADGDSVKRNARIRDNHKPYIVLTDYLKIDEKSKLTTSVYAIFGRTSSTNLNWYDAADPRPDYYKRLPSYYTNRAQYDEADAATTAWQNNTSTSQLNWDQLYFANSKNMYSVENANGEAGNTVTGNRSKYIVEEYRVDPRRFGINSVYNNKLNEKMYLTAGFNAYSHTSHNYRMMSDLLGGDFWVDVDQFAERDFSNDSVAQNDLSTTNKLIGVGDKFGYDYNIHVNKSELFGQVDFKLRKIDAYAGLTTSYTSFWRTGNLQNGRFPEESLGDSEKNNFFNYGIKAGAVYKITGRHLITGNIAYLTRAPYSRNAFISPRTRDQIIDSLQSTKIMSGDLSYVVRYPKLKVRLTGYYTQIDDQVWARSFYHDEFRTFVNYMMTDVDQLFTGIELGVEKTLGAFVIQAAGTHSMSLYNSRPNATITRDNSEEVIAENRTIYFKNYRIGGMPQTAGSIGFKYNAPKYWYAGTNFNYFAEIYLDPNPDRRTEEALANYVDTDPQIGEIIDQEKLENGYSLNIYGGKSWKLKNNSFVRLNINVNNVLNNTSFKTGGFEQLRYDVTQIDRFPPKYGYMYGLTYFAMVSYLF